MPVHLHGQTWDHERGLGPLRACSEQYRELEPDVIVEWETRSLEAFGNQSVVDLAERYDLIVIDHPHVGSIGEGAIVALDEIAPADQLRNIAELAVGPSYDSYVYAGHLWALPIDAAAQIAAYRPDVLPDADVPKSWSDVESLAEDGGVIWPLMPTDALCSFFTLAANRGSPCVNHDDEFMAEADASEILERMASVACHLPARCHTTDAIGALNVLAGETAAVYIPLVFGYTNYSRSDFTRHRVRVTDIPTIGDAGPVGSILGGAGLAVSARSRHIDQAVQHALWVASPEVQRTTYVAGGGQPALSSAWDDTIANDACDNFFRRARPSLEGSWLRPRRPGFVDFQKAAAQLIAEYLRSVGSADAVARNLREIYYTVTERPGR